MVVAYRIGAVTYALLKRLIRTPYVTLFNIAADDAVAPELIQARLHGRTLAAELAGGWTTPACAAPRWPAQYAALDKMGRGAGRPRDASGRSGR